MPLQETTSQNSNSLFLSEFHQLTLKQDEIETRRERIFLFQMRPGGDYANDNDVKF